MHCNLVNKNNVITKATNTMSLKSIRESYSKLLTVFNDAGIKLTEAQKADLDTFILALESTMSEQR